jgi:hypothetical protein
MDHSESYGPCSTAIICIQCLRRCVCVEREADSFRTPMRSTSNDLFVLSFRL